MSSSKFSFEKEFIFDNPPFASCHASTIEESHGNLIASWFGGPHEGHQDVGIWISRKSSGKWTNPVEVTNGLRSTGNKTPCWNPVLFQPKSPLNAPLMLFYKIGAHPIEWQGMVMESKNGGKTWSKPEYLPEGFLGPIKNKPIQFGDGTIVCPSSTEDRTDVWLSHLEFTDVFLKNWDRTDPIPDEDSIMTIQPSILIHPNDTLQAIGRSRKGRIWESWSKDLGRTWSKISLTNLPNPNSGTDAVTLADGRHLLIYNRSEKHRYPLNLAISSDGKNWQDIAVLETEPGEYSYPAIIQTDDGLVHMTYTWKRLNIRHVAFNPVM